MWEAARDLGLAQARDPRRRAAAHDDGRPRQRARAGCSPSCRARLEELHHVHGERAGRRGLRGGRLRVGRSSCSAIPKCPRDPEGARAAGGSHPGGREAARRVSAHGALRAARAHAALARRNARARRTARGRPHPRDAAAPDRDDAARARPRATCSARSTWRSRTAARAAALAQRFEGLDAGWVFPKRDDERLELLLALSSGCRSELVRALRTAAHRAHRAVRVAAREGAAVVGQGARARPREARDYSRIHQRNADRSTARRRGCAGCSSRCVR